MFVIVGIDRIQHHLWNYITDPGIDKKLTENIEDYFRSVDEFIGELCSEYLGSSNIFIVSDHGFAKFHGDFVIDAWLSKNGYLKIRNKKIGSWKTVLKRVLKNCGINVRRLSEQVLNNEKINKLQLSASNIDWLRSQAYGASINGININLKGRDTLGCVAPVKYEEIREKIISDLLNVTDCNGFKILRNAFKKEDVYGEVDTHPIPDIILEFNEDVLHRGINTEDISEDTELFRSQTWLSGNHIRNGIFLAAGNDINNCNEETINIEDLLPTLLALNNELIPEHLDGKVIRRIFKKDIHESYTRFSYSTQDNDYQYTQEGEQDLKEKLRSLGYM